MNDFLQFMHLKGFSPGWVFKWHSKWCFSLKVFKQWWHLKGLSPVCTAKCIRRWLSFVVKYEHSRHWCNFTVFKCCLLGICFLDENTFIILMFPVNNKEQVVFKIETTKKYKTIQHYIWLKTCNKNKRKTGIKNYHYILCILIMRKKNDIFLKYYPPNLQSKMNF